MKKRKPAAKAKAKAWSAFSRYIRTRDCIRFSGDPTRGICVTCQRPYEFKALQAGHFIAGRTNAILFDEEAVYAQCYGCNVGRSGAHVEYFIFMEKEHGREKIDALRAKKSQAVKFTQTDYERIEQDYIHKYEALCAKLSI